MIYRPNLVQMITWHRIDIGSSNFVQILISENKWSLSIFEINSWKVKVTVAFKLMIYRQNLVQIITTDRIYLGPSNSIQIFILEFKWSLSMLLTITLFFPEMTAIFPNQFSWYQLMNLATSSVSMWPWGGGGGHDCFSNRHLVSFLLLSCVKAIQPCSVRKGGLLFLHKVLDHIIMHNPWRPAWADTFSYLKIFCMLKGHTTLCFSQLFDIMDCKNPQFGGFLHCVLHHTVAVSPFLPDHCWIILVPKHCCNLYFRQWQC